MLKAANEAWSQTWQQVNFGYMHEDSAVEKMLMPANGKALCVLSGGDIAYSLSASGHHVTAVDVNDAQLRLHRLKMIAASSSQQSDVHLWSRALIRDLTDDSYLTPCMREDDLTFWKQGQYRNRPLIAAGRIDARLRFIARWIAPWVLPPGFLNWLQQGSNHTQLPSPSFDYKAWHTAWGLLRFAIAVFFPSRFRKHLPADLIARLKRRFEDCCKHHLPSSNPLLLRMLNSKPESISRAYDDSWPQENADNITVLNCSLDAAPVDQVDLISASNVLDTEPPEALLHFIDSLSNKLTANGVIILRSLFRDTEDWPGLPDGWMIDQAGMQQALNIDRAPLCKTSIIIRRLG